MAAAVASGLGLGAPARAAVDWPSYNRTLASDRYAPLAQIDRGNVKQLKALCTYDLGETTSFQSSLVEVGGAIYATTEQDTISIDPDTCKQNWRVHEDIPLSVLKVARGAAVLDGRVFRGGVDGKVRAYDAKTGKLQWATQIGDRAAGDSMPASPIAWNGMVFIGNGGGDSKGVKGRMYGLDAATGAIAWEFYLVPKGPNDRPRGPQAPGSPTALAESWKTADGFPISGGATWTTYTLDPSTGLLYVPGGNPAPDFVNAYRQGSNLFTGSVVVLDARTGAYRKHFQLVPHDFHDWDVGSAPAVFSQDGQLMLAVTPKDGRLYGIDLTSDSIRYRVPATRVENEETPLTAEGVHFCPGSQGGSEWNGPAYDPLNRTIVTGEVEWCATVRTLSAQAVRAGDNGKAWSGARDGFGKLDDPKLWAGWITAFDAATGKIKWQYKAPAPIMSGVTPTAGGLVFVGDMNGHLYAFNSTTGDVLWTSDVGSALGGGVISYDTGKGQRLAVAAGMSSPIWPTPKATARIVVFGLN